VATTTVRVTEHTHAILRELASAKGASIQAFLEELVERCRREQFFADLTADYERLRQDPVAWEEELAERKEWEATLADGLDDV
jgi:hypothetical protein